MDVVKADYTYGIFLTHPVHNFILKNCFETSVSSNLISNAKQKAVRNQSVRSRGKEKASFVLPL